MATKRKRAQEWRFLHPDEVSGPANFPEAIAQYLDKKLRKNRSSSMEDVKKHLFFLGWTMEHRDKRGQIIYRYISPERKTYYSLLKVCAVLLRGSSSVPMPDQKRRRMDCGDRFVDSGRRVLKRTENLHEDSDNDGDDEDYQIPSSRPVKRFRAKHSPQSVIDWYMIGIDKSYSGAKKSEVKSNAVGHLLAIGWELYRIQKKERHELRYKSPTGKIYMSLRTACKACIDHGGCTDPVLGFQSDLREPKVRTGKDFALVMKLREASNRSKLRDAVQKSSETASSSHRNPRTVLSWLIDNDMILPRDKVYCLSGKKGIQLTWGRINRHGIKCDCCSKVFSLRRFEAHAGGTKRNPAANIFLEDERSLLDCQKELILRKSSGNTQKSAEIQKGGFCHDQQDEICAVCHLWGDLLLCDECPASFHINCLGLNDVPSGDWFCPSCCCVICGHGRYPNGEFLKCAQCEKCVHFECLNNAQQIDKQNWFCTKKCEEIHLGLQKLLGKQITVIKNSGLTWTLLKTPELERQNKDSDATVETCSKLYIASAVLHECFEPLKSPFSKNDLEEDVIFSRKSEVGRLNFGGFYTVLLEKDGEIITVATVRVYGEEVAEVPLVATRFHYRRRGMCRALMKELEAQLINLGVKRLALPAAPSALGAWTGAFGFSKMTPLNRSELLSYTFLSFQDTIMCQKLLPETTSFDRRMVKRMKRRVVDEDIIDIADYDGQSSMSDSSDR